MADPFRVEIVSVESRVWAGEADMVVARTTEGELAVLAGHAPLLGQLKEPSRVRVRTANDEVSWDILLEDTATLYGLYAQGEPLSLPPKTDSFKGWAERLAESRVLFTDAEDQKLFHLVGGSEIARQLLLGADDLFGNIQIAAHEQTCATRGELDGLIPALDVRLGSAFEERLDRVP